MEQKEKHIHHHLIERLRQFDREAQGQLYQHYYHSLYNTAYRLVLQADIAEDLLHDSFIEAYRKINQLDDNRFFGPWIKKILIRKCLHFLNRKSPEFLFNEEDRIEEAGIDEIALNEEVLEIKKALQQLALNYRTVFSLYVIEGYDHNEIAEILNISASTSRSQLTRAKEKIRNIIQKDKSHAI